MRLNRDNIIAVTLGLVILVANFISGDWSPWAEGFFGVLALLVAVFCRQYISFGNSWFAPERWMAITLGVTGMSIFWSTNYYTSFRMWMLLFIGFLLFAAARTITEAQRAVFLKWFAIITTVGALWALIDQLRTHIDRASGFLQNANALGGYLILALPITIALALAARGVKRWIWWFTTGIVAITLARTASLTGLASLILVGACFAIAFRNSFFRVRILIRSAVIVIALVIVAMGFNALQQNSIQKGFRLDQVISAQHFSSSFTQRWGYIVSATHMVKDSPIVGMGLGTYQQNYPRYAYTLFEQPRYVHNHFLEIAAEAGLVSGVAFLGLIVVIIAGAFRGKRLHTTTKEWWYLGILAALLASSVNALFDFSWHFPAVWFGFWILAGMVFKRYEKQRRSRPLISGILLLFSVVAFIRALCVIASFTNFQRGATALDNGQPQVAVAYFTSGLRWDPDPYRRRQLVNALWLEAKGDANILSDARRQADIAIRWAKTDYNGYRIAGRVAFAQKMYSDADYLFAEAIRLDHFFHLDIYNEYINFLVSQNRYSDARNIGASVKQAYTDFVWSSNPYIQSDLKVIQGQMKSIEGKQQ